MVNVLCLSFVTFPLSNVHCSVVHCPIVPSPVLVFGGLVVGAADFRILVLGANQLFQCFQLSLLPLQ